MKFFLIIETWKKRFIIYHHKLLVLALLVLVALVEHLEIDVLAYANVSINSAYIVKVKSHPREDSIIQLKNILQRFRLFFPEHKDKELYGILAAVDLSPNLREKILQEGLYVARIHDQVFELDIPENFRPQTF